MKLDVLLEERFDEPINEVWEALTDPAVLAQWLMENDFEARVGKRFTLRRTSAAWTGAFECEVLELQPPHRMVWSWASGDDADRRVSRVMFELRADGVGTVLTLKHAGEADEGAGEIVVRRWPARLAELRAALGRAESF